VSASAGTITIVDGTNDIISFTTDSDATTARLNTANCNTAEAAATCIFGISALAGTGSLGTSLDHPSVSLTEPVTGLASDTLVETDQGGGLISSWSFHSDTEALAAPNSKAATVFSLLEDGTAQTVVTLTYHSATGLVLGTDTIKIQSDVEPVGTPEPASASLLLLGGGLLVAVGRLRKRVRG